MLGQTLDQRYKIVSQIGAGGLADVFLGRDLKLGRPVAIKVLRSEKVTPETLARLRSEVELQAQLDHPAIVRVYDVGTGATPYLVMEFVNGANFETVLRRMSLASLPRRLYAVIQVLHGLEALHTRKFLHRDLKPSNILISRDGIAKLADFGLCRLLEQDVGLTREGSTVGTVLYIPPEQLTGTPVDHRADLYALGVILFQCCTDRVPFRGSAVDVTHQHVYAQPESPRKLNPQVPTELESLVLRLLEKTPDRRPASAAVVRSELERILGKYWPDLTEASMRTALGAKARTRDEQSASLSDENYRTRDGGNDALEIATGASWKSSTQSLPDDLPELKLVGESAAKANNPVVSPKAQAPTAATAVESFSVAKTPACQTDAPSQVATEQPTTSPVAESPTSSTKRAKKSERRSAKANAEQDAWETDAFEELAESEAYAPTRRRRTKPKRALPKWLTPSLMLKTASSIAALAILWGVAGPLVALIDRLGQKPPPPPPITVTPTVAPEPPKGPAFVTVQTSVKGARVLIDGKVQGTTPLDKPVELPAGEYLFELTFGKEKRVGKLQLQPAQQLIWPAPTEDFSTGQITETGRRAVCLLRTPDGHGSGFLVQDQHTIVTAAHVIEDARSLDDLEFIFSPSADKASPNEDELKLKGVRLIHFDRTVDVAVLRLNDAVPEDRQPLLLKQEKVELQVPVISVGNPGFRKGQYLPLDTASGVVTNNNPLLTTCNVKGGYSGGPVFNSQTSEVVGITSAKLVCTDIGGRNAAFVRSRLSHVHLVRKALDAWNLLNPEDQTARAEQVQREWTQRVSDRRVFEAGVYLAFTSELYHLIATGCADYVKNEFKTKGIQKAVEANDNLIDLRKHLKKEFNPELEIVTDQFFKTAMNDELIDMAVRTKLEEAHQKFEQLQNDATKMEGYLDIPAYKKPFRKKKLEFPKDFGNDRPPEEMTFEHGVDKAKENLDKILKPLLKELADAKRLDVEDYEYPRLSK